MINIGNQKEIWSGTCHGRWMREECEAGLVSVIVPTFNREKYLVEAMDSVYAQTYRPVELLVVDDGSTDDTAHVVKEWGDTHGGEGFRLRYFSQKNSGAPAARNLGLIESQGEYIQFLDSDDLLHSEKFEIQVGLLACDLSLDFVYSGTGKFTEKADWHSLPYAGYPLLQDNLITGFLRGHMWNTLSGLYCRHACISIGPWNERALIYQDWDYNIRFILGRPQVSYLRGTLSLARMSGAERITNRAESQKYLQAILDLNIEWEKQIRMAGQMDDAVEYLLVDRRFSITVKALRYGFMELARESAEMGSRLQADPNKKFRYGIWKALAGCHGRQGYYLSCGIFFIMAVRRSIKHIFVSACGKTINR